MSVVVQNCPDRRGGGDCDHMGEVYVCLKGLDECKGVSVQALYVAKNALYWKFFKRRNSTHLTLQNTKTSLYKLSKNHLVFTLLEIFGSDRRNLQFTVSLDHPIEICQNFIR